MCVCVWWGLEGGLIPVCTVEENYREVQWVELHVQRQSSKTTPRIKKKKPSLLWEHKTQAQTHISLGVLKCFHFPCPACFSLKCAQCTVQQNSIFKSVTLLLLFDVLLEDLVWSGGTCCPLFPFRSPLSLEQSVFRAVPGFLGTKMARLISSIGAQDVKQRPAICITLVLWAWLRDCSITYVLFF